MKLLLLSSLFAAVYGAAVAPTTRYHVDDATSITFDDATSTFTVVYQQTNAQGGETMTTMITSGTDCTLAGNTPVAGSGGNDGVSGVSVTSETNDSQTGPGSKASPEVKVKVQPAAGVMGATENVQFCLFYGSGTGTGADDIFGFYEVFFDITFSFTADFTGVTFQTKAYAADSSTGNTKDIKAKAWNCIQHENVVAGNAQGPSPAYFPGQIICIKVCPVDAPDYKISDILTLTVATADIVAESAESYGQYAEEVDGDCTKASFLIPARWFTVYDSATVDVNVEGTSEFTAKATTRRLLESGRELEESGEARVDNTVGIVLEPAQESSASGVMAGAAAAAAMGAALLI